MNPAEKPFSLYIHIPYCISKCPYCDFNSHVVSEIPEKQYTEALLHELDGYGSRSEWRNQRAQSIFFGGGTPSTFESKSIGRILDRLAATFAIDADCEITLEANPGTIDQENFFGYREAGVNRISVGVQSFEPRLLKFLGRAHSGDDARKALCAVKQAGFANFSFDLMYANPSQTLAELEADLDEALAFQSPHLSAYNLTFEEGTPFGYEFRSGRMKPLTEDEEIAMAELIERKLGQAGLARYEISNYARPGFRSRHNMNYWRCGDYLGLGAGAHSYNRLANERASGQRWSNEKNPARYMAAIAESGQAVVERETIETGKAAGEFMFLGLRMIEGISIEAFRARFDKTPVELFSRIASWLDGELMEEQGGFLRLTGKGLMVANSIFVEFM